MDSAPERVFKAIESMPAFPKSVQQVLQLASDINCLPKDLVAVIKHDPIFTLKILKVVNSPFIGLRQKITSIHQASVYLGVNTLKNLALSLAAIGALPMKNDAGFDMNAFWLHSLAVAIISRKLAEMFNIEKSRVADFFSAGLLHDIGKVAFALYLPAEFKESLRLATASYESDNPEPLFEVESRVIGVNHADIGAMVAKKWGLPDDFSECIARHHRPDIDNSDLVAFVFAADQASKTRGYGFSGEALIEELTPAIQQRVNMNLDRLVRDLPDLTEELEKTVVIVAA